jgi:hypothetical protein
MSDEVEAQVHGFSNFWKISKEQTRFVVQFHKKIVPVCQENWLNGIKL